MKESKADGLLAASPIHAGFWSPRLVLLLAVSIVLLVSSSVLALRSVTAVATANAWSMHTERVRFQIVRVVQLLTDIETSERGFAATGDDEFLTPERAAMPVLPRELGELAGLTADNPVQRVQVGRLMAATEARAAHAQMVIERAAGGDLRGARALIATGDGKRAMDTVRAVAAQMQAEEDRLLGLRSDAARRAQRNAQYAAWVAGALAVFLVTFVAYATTREARRARRAHEDLATTLRSVGDAVIATDAAGGIRFMNRVAEELTGWRESAARGLPLEQVFNIVHEDTRARVESPVVKVIREGTIVGLANHTILIARDSKERAIEDSGAPIWDGAKLVGVVLVFRDATVQRAGERALIASEQRFRAAIAAVAGVLWTNTAEGEMRGEQPGWAALTGQPLADYQGFGWAKAVHPDDAQASIDAWMDAVSEKRLFVFEHRVRRHDGQWRRFSIRAVPLMDEKGAIREWVGVHTDITEQRNGEQALRHSEARFRALANAMPQIVWTERPDGAHEYFNLGWYAYTGLSEQESKLRSAWTEVLHPEDEARSGARWTRSRTVGVPYEDEFRLRRHDGAYRWFLARAVADVDSDGRILQWFGTCTDIDSTKRTEENLRRTEVALREADLRKDVFLATLSHELRNPLAPIRNAAMLLENPSLSSEDLNRSRLIIARQVRHMASLLDDLLDVSRITRGVFALKKRHVNLQTLLAEALETARPVIDAKRHIVTLEWPEKPIEIEADPVRLVQVIANLLTNAAKYTDPEGHITFRVVVENELLTIMIRDTGIGLTTDALTKVFDMFSQVDGNQERTEGGLGIGLALVKGLVELHGGRVEARSGGAERGSEFEVMLPCVHSPDPIAPQSPASMETAPVPELRHRVVIADDNRDGADSLAMLLNLSGFEVYTAHTGPEALEAAIRHKPRVAILDIGMPGMNGYELARRIRGEAWGTRMMLIAVTGWGQEQDKLKAQTAGFDHHFTKPVDFSALEQVLRSL